MMGVYACFCEVDHDCAPPEQWCEPCRERLAAETSKQGVWVAGFNMPGYLPESEPEGFASFADAKAYMIDTLERHGDHSFDAGDSMRESAPGEAETLLAEADELSGVMEDLNLASEAEWGVIVGNTSYWIIFDASLTLANFDVEVTPAAAEPIDNTDETKAARRAMFANLGWSVSK